MLGGWVRRGGKGGHGLCLSPLRLVILMVRLCSMVYIHVCIIITHLMLNVHINTRSGKEMFHTSSMTSPCSKV